MGPERLSASDELVHVEMEAGDRFLLMQLLASAEACRAAEMTRGVLLSGLNPAATAASSACPRAHLAYVYPRDEAGHHVGQQYLPTALLGTYFYSPSGEGYEA